MKKWKLKMNPTNNEESCALCSDLAIEDCLECYIPLCEDCATSHYEEEHDN